MESFFSASPKNGENLLGKLVKYRKMEKNHQVLEKNHTFYRRKNFERHKT